jgi:hypothetical protein
VDAGEQARVPGAFAAGTDGSQTFTAQGNALTRTSTPEALVGVSGSVALPAGASSLFSVATPLLPRAVDFSVAAPVLLNTDLPLSRTPASNRQELLPPVAQPLPIGLPTPSLVFGPEREQPILRRVIAGVGEGIPQEQVRPNLPLPWNGDAPAPVTPADSPAKLNILDALDLLFSGEVQTGDAEGAALTDWRQGAELGVVPAVALAGLAVALGGRWRPSTEDFERKSRKPTLPA